ncbi:hypothetical protein GCM10011579_065040 [Streptomyces albiflavescens]|uniref:MarR family transcriptional regulator n=1 Tax=Streptomyces albiflavescens TaxID=1623582 RepID=A0A917YBG4_9ACTN|nr:hypothetical protein GCM10011579_065040 [Streptomyces albiflavescens]
MLLRRAHWRAAAVMEKALRPLGIELRHLAVLIVLVDRGPTVQRDFTAATGSDKAGIIGSSPDRTIATRSCGRTSNWVAPCWPSGTICTSTAAVRSPARGRV